MKPNTVLFAAPYYDNEADRLMMIEEARTYIRKHEYTQEQVRITDRDNMILVVVK